jgi:hypothetical protein
MGGASMKHLPEQMGQTIGHHLREVEKVLSRTTDLIQNPEGHRAEQLEDALNELQDQAYLARRAFRVEAVR